MTSAIEKRDLEKSNAEGTAHRIFEDLRSDVTADTTDDELKLLEKSYREDAECEGYDLHYSLYSMMVDYRDDLVKEQSDL